MITDREAATEQRQAASWGAAMERARRPSAIIWTLIGAIAVLAVVGVIYLLTRTPDQSQLTAAEAAQVQSSIDQSNVTAQTAAQQASIAAQVATANAVQGAQANAAATSAATDAAVARANIAADRANRAAATAADQAAPATTVQPQPQQPQ